MEALDRTLGFFPMSIGTSMAFEGLFRVGEHAEMPGKTNHDLYEAIYINVRTLVRNVIAAYDAETLNYIKREAIVEGVEQDKGQIIATLEEMLPNKKVVFYFCTQEGINRAFPNARFKVAETPKQLLLEALERGTYEYFYKQMEEEKSEYVFDVKLNGTLRTVLLTHQPVDLLSAPQFPDLYLLESHAGRFKTKRDWYTKLNIKKEVMCIPFTRAMLQIFGDGNQFLAQDLKVRRQLVVIGTKRKWHGMTTHSRMIEEIKLEYEPHLYDFVVKMGR